MKLATLDNGTRDGRLVVVSKDLTRYCGADNIAPTLQAALDDWDRHAPALRALAERLFITVDGNPDPNALFPQRLVVRLTDGSTIERAIPHTLGSPDAPLSPEGTAAKRALARELAGDVRDTRLFGEPLLYFANPTPTRLSRAKSRDVAQRVSTALDTNGEGALAVP